MNYLINISNLSQQIQEKLLFSKVNLNLNEGQIVALLGENGSGKSSLLKLLAGLSKPNEGIINFPKNLRLSYLSQLDTENIDKNQTVLDYLCSKTNEYWEVAVLAEEIFGLNLEENYEKLLSFLSGGEIMQLNLSLVFSQKPDLLLLDEPTNHLDILTLKNLEKHLKSKSFSAIIVSHNQQFVENTCEIIWQIQNQEITVFVGKLSEFEEYRKQLLDSKESQYRVEKSHLKKLKESEKREKEKAQKGANSVKKKYLEGSVDKIQWEYFKETGGKSSGNKSKKFKDLKTNLLSNLQTLKSDSQPITLPKLVTSKEQGKRKLFNIKKAKLEIGNQTLLKNFDFELSYGDRVAIIGKNGCGKTALVKALIQNHENLKTNPETLAQILPLENFTKYPAKISFLNQRYEIVNQNQTILENICNYCKNLSKREARDQLANFKFFTIQDVSKLASSLSGGELAKLALSMITASPIDLLILDEPTNNLDISVVKQITTALEGFEGAILVISHDFGFLRDLKISKTLILKEKKVIFGALKNIE